MTPRSQLDESKAIQRKSTRLAIARWLDVASMGILIYAYIAILIVWIYAAQTDRLPNDSDIERYARTGRGPWDHVRDLNEIVGHGMTAPFFAAVPANISLIVRSKIATACLLAFCLFSLLTIVFTHFWLID